MAYHYVYGAVPDDCADEMSVTDRGHSFKRTASIEWIGLEMAEAHPRTPEEAFIYSSLRDATPEEVAASRRRVIARAAQEFLDAVKVAAPYHKHAERIAHANKLIAWAAAEEQRAAQIDAERAAWNKRQDKIDEDFDQALKGAAA